MTNIINALALSVLSLGVWYTGESLSRFSIPSKALGQEAAAPVQHNDKPLLLAKAAKKSSGSAKATAAPGGKSGAVREKTISREKVYRGESKKVDFDAIDIGGEIKTPFGSLVNQNKANKKYDLIPIRLRWHDEMKQSTSSLENGRAGS